MIWHNTDFIRSFYWNYSEVLIMWGCGLLEAYCISYGKAGITSWIVSRFCHSFTCTYCVNTSYIAQMFIYVLIIIIIILSMPLTPENQVQCSYMYVRVHVINDAILMHMVAMVFMMSLVISNKLLVVAFHKLQTLRYYTRCYWFRSFLPEANLRTCICIYRIIQIVRGGKVSWLHYLVICGKTFAIVQQFETPCNKKEKIRWKTFAIGG